MNDFEYALRTVTVTSGEEFEIAHAVSAGTLIAACGTVAAPVPGSRWADTDPAVRCEACERLVEPAVGDQEVTASAVVEVAAEPAVVAPTRPSPIDSARQVLDGFIRRWRALSLRIRIAAGVALVVIAAAAFLLSRGGGFRPDQSSPPYQNGYAYGHDLMGQTVDVLTDCTQATVDDPASSEGKNFIAGCRAGYAARTP